MPKLHRFDKPATLYILMMILTLGDPFALPSIFLFAFGCFMVYPAVFLTCAIVSMSRPKSAAVIALIALGTIWAYQTWLFYFKIVEGSFLDLLKPPYLYFASIPCAILVVPTNYALWSVSAGAIVGPVEWIRTPAYSRLARWSRWSFIAVLVFAPVVLVLNVFFRSQTRFLTYEARWRDGDYRNWQPDVYPGWCPDGYVDTIQLSLVEFPGYEIEVCTTGARQYLKANRLTTAPVTFEVQYDMFEVDTYVITEIGDWKGEAIQRPGSSTCIHHTYGYECGGLDVWRKTKEVFHFIP